MNDRERCIEEAKSWYRIVNSYVEKIGIKPTRQSKLSSAFYYANCGFDINEVNTSTALIKVERKQRSFKADHIRVLWRFALGANKDVLPVKEERKAVFTLYNPNGKPFRVKGIVGGYIKSTPFGLFFYMLNVWVNNRLYLREAYINMKHVRWIKSPFSKMNPESGDVKDIIERLFLKSEA